MKKTIFLKITFILLSILIASTSSFAQKKGKKEDNKSKFLEGKKYIVKFYEMKPTGRGKAIESTVIIKDGKIGSDLMEEKLKTEDATYNIKLDSTYTEDDTESRMVKLEANYSKEKDEADWDATITNYDIEGTVVQKKNGIEKKKFEFAGTEKTKK